MAWVITFRTRRFDPASEPPNPVNPVAGAGVLAWLRAELVEAGYEVGEPAPEDWGWYVDVSAPDGSYLLGASGEAGEPGADVEWVVQVHRTRSFGDRLRGRHRLAPDDRLCAAVELLARSAQGIEVLAVGLDD